jgi:hypothetical protein
MGDVPAPLGRLVLKAFAWGIATAAILFVGIGLFAKKSPEKVFERIAAECEREFGPDSDAVARCRLALSGKYLLDQRADKLKSAYDRAR